MSLINRLVLKIYNNQLKDVDKKQKNMTFDSEIVIEENIPYKEENGNLCTYEGSVPGHADGSGRVCADSRCDAEKGPGEGLSEISDAVSAPRIYRRPSQLAAGHFH